MKKIHNWEELKGLENEKYLIEIEEDCGFVIRKKDGEIEIDLSTHFFYINSGTTLYGDVLNTRFGFNVEIVRS